jgi:hypothetical protein
MCGHFLHSEKKKFEAITGSSMTSSDCRKVPWPTRQPEKKSDHPGRDAWKMEAPSSQLPAQSLLAGDNTHI